MSAERVSEIPQGRHWAVLSFRDIQMSNYRSQKVAYYRPLRTDEDPDEVRKTLYPDQLLLLVSDVIRAE